MSRNSLGIEENWYFKLKDYNVQRQKEWKGLMEKPDKAWCCYSTIYWEGEIRDKSIKMGMAKL